MRFELHFSASENSYDLAPENPPPPMSAVRAPDAVLIATIDADTWEEAVRRKNVLLGWAGEESSAS